MQSEMWKLQPPAFSRRLQGSKTRACPKKPPERRLQARLPAPQNWRNFGRTTLGFPRDQGVLGVGVHAEFGDVQAFAFHFGRDAHGFDFVHSLEDGVSAAEGPQRAERSAAELAEELSGIAVEQAGDSLAGVPQVAGRTDSIPTRAISAVGEDEIGR